MGERTHGDGSWERHHRRVAAFQTADEQRDGIRILVVDDHPALRAGLEGLLRGEPDMDCVGVVDGADRLLPTLRDARPEVVILDYALGHADGLTTCFRIKQEPNAPAVVLYSAYVDRVFAVPAAIAQADATVAKSAPVAELLSAIRDVARGEVARDRPDPELLDAASARLSADDLPVAAMLLVATPITDIAQVLNRSVSDVRSGALRIVGRLQAGHHRAPRGHSRRSGSARASGYMAMPPPDSRRVHGTDDASEATRRELDGEWLSA